MLKGHFQVLYDLRIKILSSGCSSYIKTNFGVVPIYYNNFLSFRPKWVLGFYIDNSSSDTMENLNSSARIKLNMKLSSNKLKSTLRFRNILNSI